MECELCGQYEVLAKVLVDALEDAERALAHCYDCFDSIIAALVLRDVRAAIDIAEEVLDYGPGELLGGGEKMSEIQERAITAVLLERKRQDSKWGEQNHPPHYWTGILGEEYGELCEAINETIFDNGSDKGGYENMRTEAIHVAAVAIGFLECLERNKALWFPKLVQGDCCVSCGEYVPEGRMVCRVCEDDPSHALRKVAEREVTGRYGVCRGKIQETL